MNLTSLLLLFLVLIFSSCVPKSPEESVSLNDVSDVIEDQLIEEPDDYIKPLEETSDYMSEEDIETFFVANEDGYDEFEESYPSEDPVISMKDTDLFESSLKTENILFAFNSYRILDIAKDVIRNNVEYLKSNPNVDILLSGHCDERGTAKYNLALSYKRIRSVRDIYIKLGINGGRVAYVGYGEDKPFCFEKTERCYAKNRRVETKIKDK